MFCVEVRILLVEVLSTMCVPGLQLRILDWVAGTLTHSGISQALEVLSTTKARILSYIPLSLRRKNICLLLF